LSYSAQQAACATQHAPPLQQPSAELEIALELPMNASDAMAKRMSFMVRKFRSIT
jgi:hypothetical protein